MTVSTRPALILTGLLVFCAAVATVVYTPQKAIETLNVNDSPLYNDPDEVLKANPYLAYDRTERVMFNTIEEARDRFEQLLGSLKARTQDEDCDAIHSIAKEVHEAHSQFELLEIEYKKLPKTSRQNVAGYVQNRLISVVHQVTTGLVKSLLICEQSQHLYHEAVANVRLTAAKLDIFEKRMEKLEGNCVELQKVYHEAIAEIKDFHKLSEDKIEIMRKNGWIVAADQAQLERESRINPAERSLYSTFSIIWGRSCRIPVNAALGLDENGEVASSGGSSDAGSGSASAGSGGSA